MNVTASAAHEPAAEALAAIVSSAHDAVIAKTVEGIVTSWNAGAASVYGWSAHQMLGQSFEVMVPPDELHAERARHSRVAAGGAESGCRCVRVRSDGGRIDVIMSLSPIFDATGAITGVASISRPFSATERDEARFASLLEAAPDAIICVDEQGRIVTINAQVTAMFGYERDELLGSEVEVLLPDESRIRHAGLRSAFLVHPEVRTMGVGLALWGRRRDSSVFPIEVSLAPDRSRAETITIAVVRDMTDQRKLERDVAESATRLRQLAENVDIVFLLRQIDPPEVLYVSPSSLSVLGHDPSEWMTGEQVLNVHPLDRDRVERENETARAGLATESEFRLVKPNGAIQWVRAMSTAVANSDGTPERTVVTIEDITARVEAADALRQAEADAIEANQTKNLFLSRMSHELRTPLNAVLGFAQLLEMRLDESDHAEAVQQILKGGRHLLDLINDVLDISRIDAGQTPMSVEAVLVRRMVDEAVELMSTMAETAGVTLTATTISDDLLVFADVQRLRQILLNLLSNAIKYNLRQGKVWVGVEAGEHHVAFTVHDDGPGIPLELQVRMFTPFDRLGAEASGVEGTGIGLALARSLAEHMDGTLTFESEPGRGSAFTLTLPRACTGRPA